MLKIKNGKLVRDWIEPKNIYLEGGTIFAVTEDDLPAERELDAGGLYVSAGFIDTHVHGGGGADFMDGGTDPMRTAAATHLRHGTTSLCPTTCACPHHNLLAFVRHYKTLLPESGKGNLPNFIGLHLEGPFFSPGQVGAQPPEWVYPPRPAEYNEILAEAEGTILKWSYAPELPGSTEFCDTLVRHGILPCIGHTDATYDDVLRAYEHGARCLTHFYSSMSTITRRLGYRIPGVVEAGYLIDGLWAEIIADGSHLPPDLLQMICKLKGTGRMLLVTDAMRGATMPEGPSTLGANRPCIIEDGIAKVPDRSCFAGSVATADRLVRTMVKKAGCDLPTAVRMMTENPATLLGLSHKGKLLPGYDADLVLFDDDIRVQTVIVGGRVVSE